MKQSFNYDINHMAAFEIGDSHYIAIVRAHKAQENCADTEIMRLDHESEQYIPHQTLSQAVDSRFIAFDYNQEVFLFLENAERGCMLKGRFQKFNCFDKTRCSFKISSNQLID